MEFDLGIWDIENYMLGKKISRNSFFLFRWFFLNILMMILTINTSSSSHPPLRLSRGFSFRKILLFWVKLSYFMYHTFLWNTYLALRSTRINILMGLSKRLIWCWTGECYSTIDGRWTRWPLGSCDFLAGEGESDIIVINRRRLAKNTNVL